MTGPKTCVSGSFRRYGWRRDGVRLAAELMVSIVWDAEDLAWMAGFNAARLGRPESSNPEKLRTKRHPSLEARLASIRYRLPAEALI